VYYFLKWYLYVVSPHPRLNSSPKDVLFIPYNGKDSAAGTTSVPFEN
jgi:hypothetical protein